jgi:hypothetical protein
MWDGIIQSVLSATIGAIVVWLIFRRQSAQQEKMFHAQLERWRKDDEDKRAERYTREQQAAHVKAEAEQESRRKAVERIIQDLGSLIHHLHESGEEVIAEHIRKMDESRNRGDYNLESLPSTLHNLFLFFQGALTNYRRLLNNEKFKEGDRNRLVPKTVLHPICMSIKTSFDRYRDGQF